MVAVVSVKELLQPGLKVDSGDRPARDDVPLPHARREGHGSDGVGGGAGVLDDIGHLYAALREGGVGS